jgi:hypothetical protein
MTPCGRQDTAVAFRGIGNTPGEIGRTIREASGGFVWQEAAVALNRRMGYTLTFRCLHVKQPLLRPGTLTILPNYSDK